MIVAEELSKRFDNFLAVDRVSLDVRAGQVLVLLGQNGAGKTTTVRMLTSILEPSGGRAWVAGFDVVQEAEKVRASVGVLTEHHGLYGRMNAEEYLEFFASLYGLNLRDVRPRIQCLAGPVWPRAGWEKAPGRVFEGDAPEAGAGARNPA